MRKLKSKCGYVVYETTPKECIEITGGFGICDMCAKTDKTIYLVPVLNHALCQNAMTTGMKEPSSTKMTYGLKKFILILGNMKHRKERLR